MLKYKNVLIGVSGSIAAYKTCELISLIKKSGRNVKVVCTDSALKFVGPASFEGLSGEPLYSDTFEHGKMMSHIHLARWADIMIVAPASLAQLARMANGLADNLLTNIYFALGAGKPCIVAPAMNTQMWENEKTQRLIEELQKQKVQLLLPDAGQLACGEVGAGRMQEAQAIFSQIFVTAKTGLRALITSGGTREPIDAVRFIGNHSTGRTGAALADLLQSAGIDVTLLHSEAAIQPQSSEVQRRTYVSFKDLQAELHESLAKRNYDLIIHAAAVSDFSVQANGEKIESQAPMELKLIPNPKLIASLRELGGPDATVVGFKLTVNASPEKATNAVLRVFETGKCDLVVHNDLGQITGSEHKYNLYSPTSLLMKAADLNEMAQLIIETAKAKKMQTQEVEL